MNEEKEITWADSSWRRVLTRASTNVNCTEQYMNKEEHPVSEHPSRLGLRLVGDLSEMPCSHQIRKRIRRGIVWQVASSSQLAHPESLAPPSKPYTH